MKIALIDTSYPINTRNTKILETLKEKFSNVEIHVIAWDREGKIDLPYIYKKKSPLGDPLKKLLNLVSYKKFVHKAIKEIVPDIVIASHWDSLLIAPKLNRKKQMLIYENLDIPTGRFRPIIKLFEIWKLQQVDLIIHASRFFEQLYPKGIEQVILENKPVFNNTENINYSTHSPLRLTWIGTVRYKEILYNLIDVVKENSSIKLTMHGNGPDYLEIKEYVSRFSNITMTGCYDYNDVKEMYQNSDIIWAAYPNKDYNVKYAISNKFHESLIMSVPCIFSNSTKLGDMVEGHKIGLTVNPYSRKDICALLDKVINNDINLKEIRENISNWNKENNSWDVDFLKITKKIEDFLKCK